MKTKRLFFFSLLAIAMILVVGSPTKSQFIQNGDPIIGLIAGRNVNMLSGYDPTTNEPYDINGQRQNEPSIAVSTRNPLHLIAGANDWQPLDMDIVGEELPGVHQEVAAADAWMGIFTSTDGGESWKNRLLPGSLVDDSPESLASPIYGYEAAADPVWRAGAAGIFFGTGITFNRGQRGLGALFVARYIDRNNREGGDPIRYIDTKVIDIGNAGHFIDKCWLVVDVPRPTEVTTLSPVTLPNGDIVPRMNVFVVYTSFMGDTEEDVHGKLMISVSHDSGQTWTEPSQITDAGQPYQAATLAIDPRNGRLHLAWRRFAKDEHTDAIMMLSEKTPKDVEEIGYTHEKLKFTKPIIVQEITPFDQPTAETMFRTNTYPSMTVDHNGIVYLAYAMRNEFDYSRIHVSVWDSDNDLWYGPTEICLTDNLPEDPTGVRLSHMFMPTIRYGAGKITLAWYDQRWDISGVYSYYINDAYPLLWRHTIDVRAAQSDPSPNLDFSESIQVSKYPWLLLADESGVPTGAMQLKHFFPGLEIFQQGTRGFIGDYIDLAPSPPFIPDGEGGWSYNTGIQSTGIQNTRIQTETAVNPVFHVAWADNRDVSGDLTGFNPPNDPEVPCLDPGQTNSRNQNIYTSRLTRGIIAGSPGNTKKLNIKRAFVVFVKNTTPFEKYVDLTITSNDGATANFVERGVEYGVLSNVYIPPFSTTSRTVSVDDNVDWHASVTINVFDSLTQTPLAQVTLNPDPTNPEVLEDPDGNIIDEDTETHTPHVGAYHVIEWNYDLANPHVGAPHVGAWAPSANDDWVTPHVGAPHVGAPHVGAPHVGAPHVGAVNIIAPHVGATHLYDDIPADSSMTDVYVGVENVGNTTSSYSISTLPVEIPAGILVQLLVYRVHKTPSADGCDPIFEEHHELISSITPHVGATPLGTVGGNPLTSIQYVDLPVDVNVPVETGGRIVLCYRILDPDKYDDIKVEPTSFVPVVQQDVEDIIDDTPQGPPPPALAVTTTTLDTAYIGLPYNQTLTADGGYGTYSWSLKVAPIWMDIDQTTGEIYGTPSVTDIGTNIEVTVSVTDDPPGGINQQTSYKTFYIDVNETFALTVDAYPIGGGSLTKNPDKENYAVGESVEITAITNAGYTFSGWAGDVAAGHEMDNPITIVMDESKVLTANFTALPIGDGSLVSWWRGENNAYDIVGGNHGILQGSGTTYSPGVVNQAFDFAGTDDYITAPGTNIDNLLEFTVECWIKASSFPSQSDPIPGSVFVELYGEKAVLRYDGWSEGLGYQYLHFYMRNSDNNLHHVWVDSVLQTDCFHHVVGTYDGNIMRLYLDGYEVGQNPTPSIFLDGGGVSLGGQAHLSGLLDEVRIYNRALDPEEIRNNYVIVSDPDKCPHPDVLIDGVMSPGEWDSAMETSFNVNLPPYGPAGGTTPGTLFVMNDNKNLYLAVRYPQSIGDIGESLTFEFDNNGDEGPRENGDDVIGINPGFFTDSFRTNEPPCEPGHPPAYCAPRDVNPDLDPPGDNDGMGAFGHDGTYTVYEASHPLNTQDSSRDFSLSPGDLLGVRFDLHIVTGPGDSHDVTSFPASSWLVIYIFNPIESETYDYVAEWGSEGTGDGQFDNPLKVSVDNSAQYVYVADDYNHRIQKFTTGGSFETKWGSFSSTGTGDYEFAYPVSVAVDPTGQYVYVVDAGHDRIKKFTSDGIIVGWWGLDNLGFTGWHDPESGRRGESGTGDGQFNSPSGIAVDNSGNVYVADHYNYRIQKFTATGIFLTKWGSQGTGDGQFEGLYGLAVDDAGNVYAVESGNDRIQKFTSTGAFLGWWGLDDLGYTGWHDPGSGRTAVEGNGDGQLYNANRIGIDRKRCVFVSEGSGNRIQKFTSTGTFITKWGGYGSGDGQFQFPFGVAIDKDDYVYVADRYNGRIQKFQKQ